MTPPTINGLPLDSPAAWLPPYAKSDEVAVQELVRGVQHALWNNGLTPEEIFKTATLLCLRLRRMAHNPLRPIRDQSDSDIPNYLSKRLGATQVAAEVTDLTWSASIGDTPTLCDSLLKLLHLDIENENRLVGMWAFIGLRDDIKVATVTDFATRHPELVPVLKVALGDYTTPAAKTLLDTLVVPEGTVAATEDPVVTMEGLWLEIGQDLAEVYDTVRNQRWNDRKVKDFCTALAEGDPGEVTKAIAEIKRTATLLDLEYAGDPVEFFLAAGDTDPWVAYRLWSRWTQEHKWPMERDQFAYFLAGELSREQYRVPDATGVIRRVLQRYGTFFPSIRQYAEDIQRRDDYKDRSWHKWVAAGAPVFIIPPRGPEATQLFGVVDAIRLFHEVGGTGLEIYTGIVDEDKFWDHLRELFNGPLGTHEEILHTVARVNAFVSTLDQSTSQRLHEWIWNEGCHGNPLAAVYSLSRGGGVCGVHPNYETRNLIEYAKALAHAGPWPQDTTHVGETIVKALWSYDPWAIAKLAEDYVGIEYCGGTQALEKLRDSGDTLAGEVLDHIRKPKKLHASYNAVQGLDDVLRALLVCVDKESLHETLWTPPKTGMDAKTFLDESKEMALRAAVGRIQTTLHDLLVRHWAKLAPGEAGAFRSFLSSDAGKGLLSYLAGAAWHMHGGSDADMGGFAERVAHELRLRGGVDLLGAVVNEVVAPVMATGALQRVRLGVAEAPKGQDTPEALEAVETASPLVSKHSV